MMNQKRPWWFTPLVIVSFGLSLTTSVLLYRGCSPVSLRLNFLGMEYEIERGACEISPVPKQPQIESKSDRS
ncbi:hypothetical protein HW132_06775 [Brasilonema sp. CT11]|nr:hypothetical protein [Brasilonema sp. CT11]